MNSLKQGIVKYAGPSIVAYLAETYTPEQLAERVMKTYTVRELKQVLRNMDTDKEGK